MWEQKVDDYYYDIIIIKNLQMNFDYFYDSTIKGAVNEEIDLRMNLVFYNLTFYHKVQEYYNYNLSQRRMMVLIETKRILSSEKHVLILVNQI